jgi:hypothetical protein
VTNIDPDVFLTVHSGTFGMYVPYAYEEKEGTKNQKNLDKINESLN